MSLNSRQVPQFKTSASIHQYNGKNANNIHINDKEVSLRLVCGYPQGDTSIGLFDKDLN